MLLAIGPFLFVCLLELASDLTEGKLQRSFHSRYAAVIFLQTLVGFNQSCSLDADIFKAPLTSR